MLVPKFPGVALVRPGSRPRRYAVGGRRLVDFGRQHGHERIPDLVVKRGAAKHLADIYVRQVLAGSYSAEPSHYTGNNVIDALAHRAPSGAPGRQGSVARFHVEIHTHCCLCGIPPRVPEALTRVVF